MSRRHSSSRRRNYGRRQHEVRERRPRALGPFDSRLNDDWPVLDSDDDRPPKSQPSAGASDSFGGNVL